MKTLIKSFALALSFAVVSAVSSFAGVPETNPIGRPSNVATYKTSIYPSLSGTLNIALDKETNGRIGIRLVDKTGGVLYTQQLGKNERGCRVRLNMSELEDGTYTLEISNGVETTTQQIVISTKQPSTPNRLVTIH